MTRVARALWALQATCCASIVTKLAQLGRVQTAGDRVEKSVEGGAVGDAPGGNRFDVGGRQAAKVDAFQLRGDDLRGIHRGGDGEDMRWKREQQRNANANAKDEALLFVKKLCQNC